MCNTERTAFVPVLTVMVDYGNAPFLWLVNNPDQPRGNDSRCLGFPGLVPDLEDSAA